MTASQRTRPRLSVYFLVSRPPSLTPRSILTSRLSTRPPATRPTNTTKRRLLLRRLPPNLRPLQNLRLLPNLRPLQNLRLLPNLLLPQNLRLLLNLLHLLIRTSRRRLIEQSSDLKSLSRRVKEKARKRRNYESRLQKPGPAGRWRRLNWIWIMKSTILLHLVHMISPVSFMEDILS